MGRVVTAISAVAFATFCLTCQADTKKKYSVAVLGIEDICRTEAGCRVDTVCLDYERIQSIEGSLVSWLERSGWPNLIPPSELKSNCETRSCQIEKALEAGADLMLIFQIEISETGCKLSSSIYNPSTKTMETIVENTGHCGHYWYSSSPLFMAHVRQLSKYKPFLRETRRLKAMAFRLTKAEQYHAAIDVFKEILEIDSSNCEAMFGLEKVYAMIGENEQSLVYMRRFLDSCRLNIHEPGDFPIPKEYKRLGGAQGIGGLHSSSS